MALMSYAEMIEADRAPPMQQTYLDILQLAEAHDAHEGEALMSALMGFEATLKQAVEALRAEVRTGRSPDAMLPWVNAPMALSLRMAALNLCEVTRRAAASLAEDISSGLDKASAKSTGDVLAWLAIADATRVAVVVLFEASILNGRAPNGRKIRV